MTTKACTQCGVVKPLAAFHKKKTGKFGRAGLCSQCTASQNRAYREANREKLNAQNRAWREANREKYNAQQRAYSRARHELIGHPTNEKWQEISVKHATRNGEPWSEEEDRYLISSTNREIDDALALQRSYRSVAYRRLHLRRAGLIKKQSA